MTERNTVIPIKLGQDGSLPIPQADSSRGVLDLRDRPLRDLRISVTDRCNFRCTYCMPKEVFNESYPYLPQSEILSFEEIVRVAVAAESLGVEKIRLTGGEPLLRKGLENLISKLRQRLPTVEIALTTNGAALANRAAALKSAGLDRVTVSLDSLDDATFRRMNDVDFPVSRVLEAIDAAGSAGLGPVKVNMVVKRGINDHDVVNVARFFRGSGHIVRFIEFMDVGSTNGWRMDDVIPSREIVARINAFFPLEAIDPNYTGEVAERWRYVDAPAEEIGVISSVTQPFCSGCTRARLSTDGRLFTCLFAQNGYDLRSVLRGPASVSADAIEDSMAIQAALLGIWQMRNDAYSERRANAEPISRKVEMSFIGG